MRLENDQRAFARQLRRNQTDAERRMWHLLRGRRFQGFRFRRQHPIGPYFADFVCLEARLVIELDGGQHAITCARTHDDMRSDVMAAHGFTVIRFWNCDVLGNTDGVLAAIRDALPSPGAARRPLPLKRER